MKSEFTHVARGSKPSVLRKLAQAQFNLAVLEGAVTAASKSYLDGIDLATLAPDVEPDELTSTHKDGRKFKFKINTQTLFAGKSINAAQLTPEKVAKNMLSRFPDEGKEALAENICNLIKLYARTLHTNRVNCRLSINDPMENSLWHRDRHIKKRGFVTLKGSHGTFWRPNHSVEDFNPQDTTGFGAHFGAFGKVGMEDAQFIQPGDFAMWKGDVYKKPLIHTEVTKLITSELRLNLVLDEPREKPQRKPAPRR